MHTGWFGIPFWVYLAACLALSTVWLFVWPSDKVGPGAGLRYFLLRWGHSLTWALLGAACLCWALSAATAGTILAVASLPAYLAFVAAMFIGGSSRDQSGSSPN